MKLKAINIDGSKSSDVELSDEIFAYVEEKNLRNTVIEITDGKNSVDINQPGFFSVITN